MNETMDNALLFGQIILLIVKPDIYLNLFDIY